MAGANAADVLVFDLLSGDHRTGRLTLSAQGTQIAVFSSWPRSFLRGRRAAAVLATDAGNNDPTWVGIETVQVARTYDKPRSSLATVTLAGQFDVDLHPPVPDPAAQEDLGLADRDADLIGQLRRTYPQLVPEQPRAGVLPALPHQDAYGIPDLIETLYGTNLRPHFRLCKLLMICE